MSPWWLTPDGSAIRGANLTVEAGPWEWLWDEWDWDGWIKPQIDLAVDAGANCVRIIGDVVGVWRGTFTLATYRARWRQFIDYAASVGLNTYACGGDHHEPVAEAMTQEEIRDVLVGLAEEIDGDSNVIGFDVIQEWALWDPAGRAAAAAAVRAVCDRPLSFSLPIIDRANLLFYDYRAGIVDVADFLDLHIYYDAAPGDLNTVRTGLAMPFLIGEFGAPATDPAAQLARYDAIVALSADAAGQGAPIAGALVWSIVDGGVAGDFGMYSDAGVERTDLTSRFQQLPT